MFFFIFGCFFLVGWWVVLPGGAWGQWPSPWCVGVWVWVHYSNKNIICVAHFIVSFTRGLIILQALFSLSLCNRRVSWPAVEGRMTKLMCGKSAMAAFCLSVEV